VKDELEAEYQSLRIEDNVTETLTRIVDNCEDDPFMDDRFVRFLTDLKEKGLKYPGLKKREIEAKQKKERYERMLDQ
jgi:hypothetical protein